VAEQEPILVEQQTREVLAGAQVITRTSEAVAQDKEIREAQVLLGLVGLVVVVVEPAAQAVVQVGVTAQDKMVVRD
jgi:hypothetical protein